MQREHLQPRDRGSNRFAWIALLASILSIALIPGNGLIVGLINVFVLIYSIIVYRGFWRVMNVACSIVVLAAAAFWLLALSIDWAATSA